MKDTIANDGLAVPADFDGIIAKAQAMRAETLRALVRGALARLTERRTGDAALLRRAAASAARALAGRAGLERLDDHMLADIGLTRHDVVGRMILDGQLPPVAANGNRRNWAA